MDILSPAIANSASAGQFIVVIVTEKGERIPLTVVDKKNDVITVIFQELGFSTKLLGTLNEGDYLYAVSGPFGRATTIKKYGKVILVGGGAGIAEIYPVAKELKKTGNYIVAILGSRTKDLIILEEEIKKISDQLYVMTDDGSAGERGFTTDRLKEILNAGSYDFVYAVGPIPMMKKVSEVTENLPVPVIVSLNAIMIDATGMCGGCRVTVDGKARFSCVDGPEFDAHAVDWDGLIRRNRVYEDKERHICRLSFSENGVKKNESSG